MQPSHTLHLSDGRALGWAEYGASTGRPVLGFHGTPACRLLFAPADAAARRLGLRLIAPDRPGFGLSDPRPGRTLADWVDDANQLLDRLGIGSAPVLAVSGGCPYAVAMAAGPGNRVSGLALVSPLGEVGGPASKDLLSRAQRAFFLGLPKLPRLLARSAAAGRAAFLTAPDLSYSMFIAMLPGADRKVLARPEAKRIIMDMTREAVRNGIEGAMSDMSVFSRPWGVDPGQIRCPAVIWQGTEDSIVPDAVAFDLGQRIPGCTTHRLAGHGHFWIIEHVDDVLGAVDRMAAAC